MDHAYIKEHSIVERYEMGKLSAAEGASFEEHFVDCPECQNQLQTAQDFRNALKMASSKDQLLTEFKPTPRAHTFVWRAALLAAAACAGLLFLSVSLVQQTRRLNRANHETAVLRQQYEDQRQANVQLQQQLSPLGQPAPGLPAVAAVFTLNMTRGGEPGDSEPANRVTVSPSPQWVVLSLDLDGNSFESYRATLEQSSGRIVWKSESLTPASSHTLSIALASSIFQQGDYSLVLQGRSRNGNYTAAGHYSFRVKR